MEHKLIFSGMQIFLLYCCIVAVSSIPTKKAAKDQGIIIESNLLNISDTTRLAMAVEMKTYINESVDPCTDFYEFACGNWAEINPPQEIAETGYFTATVYAMKSKKIELLEITSSNDTLETPVEKKVRGFYRSCIKVEGVNRSIYKNPLLKLMAEFSTMPALDIKSWNSTQFDWMSVVAQIQSIYGISAIFHTTIMEDMNNNTINRLYFNMAAPLHLEVKSMYLDEQNQKYRDDYRDEIMKEFSESMEIPDERALKIANQILNFEIELAKGLPDLKDDVNVKDRIVPTTVENMHKKYAPVIDIKKFVTIYFGKSIEGLIYELNPTYMENLVHVINATKKETLSNYIFFRLLHSLLPSTAETGAERAKFCQKITEIYFSSVLENMAFRSFDSRKTQNDIILIFNELKKALRAKLWSNNVNWMSLRTRQVALKKLDAMRLEISSYMEMNFLKRFGDIEIDESNYFENLKNVNRYSAKREKEELFNPSPDKDDEIAHSMYYDCTKNVIKVPVLYLQPNYFWSGNYPQALKFGSIGAMIGHEIFHGFTGFGMQFNELGNLNDWWGKESMAEYQNRTECFKDQYHQYKYDGILLPRVEDQSENIADNAGVRLAFEAYMDWYTAAANDPDKINMETLPELNFSPKELFFMSFGQFWCSEIAEEFRAMRVSTDNHVPPMFRVIGPLSNYDEFSKVFKCDVDAAMNPKKKCAVY